MMWRQNNNRPHNAFFDAQNGSSKRRRNECIEMLVEDAKCECIEEQNPTANASIYNFRFSGVVEKDQDYFIKESTFSFSALMAACSLRVWRIASSLP